DCVRLSDTGNHVLGASAGGLGEQTTFPTAFDVTASCWIVFISDRLGNLGLASSSALPFPIRSMNRSGSTMSNRSVGTGLVMLLLLAVLVPSVWLLWFMSQAVKSERSVARQKVLEAYRGHLALAQERLEQNLE